jgi:hypothetical protein
MAARPPTAPQLDVNRQRHIRALAYALVGLGVGVIGRAFLGFDSSQTYAYSIVTYLALLMLNYRTMLARVPTSAPDSPRDQRR